MALGLKEAKVAKIKSDVFKIKILVDCFSANSNKRPRDRSVSSDSATDTKGQDRRASCSASKADMRLRQTGIDLHRDSEIES